jgi:UDP-glucose 4-epimerase
MKIVVTGALGHIGSRLIRELPKNYPNCNIVMVDNFLTNRFSSLFDLPDEGRYQFVEGDVLKLDLSPVFEGASVVIHLAAITDATSSFENRDHVEYVNFNATVKVADSCVQVGTPLIHLSSTSVYGTQNELVDEDCSEDELQPQSPYAETKLKEEEYLQKLGVSKGLDYITCRFGTIFGTSIGMRFHTAVNKFCWQAVMGRPITVWRTALHQKRPYLDLGDAISAFVFIINQNLFDRRVYNVLTTNATVNDIIQIISSNVPAATIEYVDTEIMNQLSYEVASERFKAHGFGYDGKLESGINATLQLLENSNGSNYL